MIGSASMGRLTGASALRSIVVCHVIRHRGYAWHMRSQLPAYLRRVRTALLLWIKTNGLPALVVLTALYVLLFLCQPPEDRLRWVGGGLQLVGVITVAIGLGRTRSLFDAGPAWQPLAETTAGLIDALRSYGRKPRVIDAGGVSMSGSSELGFAGTVRPGASATVEQHLDYLWKAIEGLDQQNAKLSRDLKAAEQRLEKQIRDEAGVQEEATTALSTKLETLSVGGLYVESFGLWCLLFGIAFSSFASELGHAWPW